MVENLGENPVEVARSLRDGNRTSVLPRRVRRRRLPEVSSCCARRRGGLDGGLAPDERAREAVVARRREGLALWWRARASELTVMA